MCSWSGLQNHDDLRAETKKNLTIDLVKEGYGSLLRFRDKGVSRITVRTMTVARALQDDVEATRKMGEILREKCQESRAAVAKRAVHAWDLQFPQLFAKSIRAWTDKLSLPEGLVELK